MRAVSGSTPKDRRPKRSVTSPPRNVAVTVCRFGALPMCQRGQANGRMRSRGFDLHVKGVRTMAKLARTHCWYVTMHSVDTRRCICSCFAWGICHSIAKKKGKKKKQNTHTHTHMHVATRKHAQGVRGNARMHVLGRPEGWVWHGHRLDNNSAVLGHHPLVAAGGAAIKRQCKVDLLARIGSTAQLQRNVNGI